MKKKNVFIVYFSLAGSTRHVAEISERQFQALGAEVSSFELDGRNKGAACDVRFLNEYVFSNDY